MTLLLIPQRYEFSSKSQLVRQLMRLEVRCCWYHKGTNFQANHNRPRRHFFKDLVVADTTKVRIFKQITTLGMLKVKVIMLLLIPQRYEFSSKSQLFMLLFLFLNVVADTTKVRIFKQITTTSPVYRNTPLLLLIPQRYEFSSKSQHGLIEKSCGISCCWYHKGTNFQANHNWKRKFNHTKMVVADTTKVRIFKQITTRNNF